MAERPRSRSLRAGLLGLGAFLFLPAWPWVAGSLICFPRWPAVVGWLAAAAWLVLPLLALRRFGLRRALLGAAVFGLLWTFVFRLAEPPRTDRDWTDDQARSVQWRLNGRTLLVENVRDFRWTSVDEFTPAWASRSYELDELERLDYLIEPLPALPGGAHVMLSFGFAGGKQLAASVEIRKERGESYSPVAGLYRRYELAYVFADERDLLGLRLNARGHELIVHPLKATPAQAERLLLAMLQRARKLEAEPEFYGTLGSNCTTNLVAHLEELRGEPLPWDWRYQLPLHSDALAWELGLIDGATSLDRARTQRRRVGPVPLEELSRFLRTRRHRP